MKYFADEFKNSEIYSLEILKPFRKSGEEVKGIIRKMVFIRLKDIYMSFLDHINQDFDDDLLFDVISMLPC